MRRTPSGDGNVVARWYMSLAFGLLDLNCFLGWRGGGRVPKSVALNIGLFFQIRQNSNRDKYSFVVEQVPYDCFARNWG